MLSGVNTEPKNSPDWSMFAADPNARGRFTVSFVINILLAVLFWVAALWKMVLVSFLFASITLSLSFS